MAKDNDKSKSTGSAGKNVIKVSLGDLVNGKQAMDALGNRTLTGKVAYRVGKALRKAHKEIDEFNETVIKIVKENDGKPSKLGRSRTRSKIAQIRQGMAGAG